jgi:Flp pilus assembly protein TadB
MTYKPSDYGITPLGQHLADSHRRGTVIAVGLCLLVAAYLIAVWASAFQASVIIVGAVVLLVVILLAYRARRGDHLETNRLMDEEIVRDFGPWGER